MRVKIVKKHSQDADEVAKKVINIGKKYGLEFVEEGEDVIIAIGGDGTFLRTIKSGKPVVGIKAGKKSILLDVPPIQVEETIARLAKGDYKVEEYPLLQFRTWKLSGLSFNEVGILLERPITIYGSVIINSTKIVFEGDGVLVSTPQGNWSWGFSITGTFIFSNSNVMQISFMNLMKSNLKSLIVPLDSKVTIRLEDKGIPQTVQLVSDGEIVGYLRSGEDEELMIEKSDKKAIVYRFYNIDPIAGVVCY